jgi:hypothetical protein
MKENIWFLIERKDKKKTIKVRLKNKGKLPCPMLLSPSEQKQEELKK